MFENQVLNAIIRKEKHKNKRRLTKKFSQEKRGLPRTTSKSLVKESIKDSVGSIHESNVINESIENSVEESKSVDSVSEEGLSETSKNSIRKV